MAARRAKSKPATATIGASAANPRFFATPADFRRWLKRNHQRATELWVGFKKKETGQPSITWPESVDEALCVGWIDGLRKRVDQASYTIRFTPRKPTSTWSAVNIKRMAELIGQGRVGPAGRAAFEKRSEKKSGIYSYEQRAQVRFDRESERRIRAHQQAWEFFQAQAPWYRRIATFWVMTAKKEETRRRRLGVLIDSSAGRRLIPGVIRPTARK